MLSSGWRHGKGQSCDCNVFVCACQLSEMLCGLSQNLRKQYSQAADYTVHTDAHTYTCACLNMHHPALHLGADVGHIFLSAGYRRAVHRALDIACRLCGEDQGDFPKRCDCLSRLFFYLALWKNKKPLVTQPKPPTSTSVLGLMPKGVTSPNSSLLRDAPGCHLLTVMRGGNDINAHWLMNG